MKFIGVRDICAYTKRTGMIPMIAPVERPSDLGGGDGLAGGDFSIPPPMVDFVDEVLCTAVKDQ